MKQAFLTGISVVVFAAAMAWSGSADAAGWRLPREACTASIEGEFRTTVNNYGSYVDYATWVCWSNEWVLADVTRCFPSGYCVPL